MSKTVLIAPANLVLQPTQVQLTTNSPGTARKTVVLVPQPPQTSR